MDIVLLDGYSLNFDLTWSKLSNLGNCTFYDQTPVDDTEEIIKRIDNAEIVITHKTPLRSEVLKALEQARNNQIIGSSQEASVVVKILDSNYKELFDKIKNEAEILFVVSSFKEDNNLNEGLKLNILQILVKHHDGKKCLRCWNYTDEPYVDVDGTVLCQRCKKVLGK